LTKELNIPIEKLSVTCFAGDNDAPRDEETARIWKEVGMPEERIYYFGKDDNWWIAGETGPCGPDTEIFYDTGKAPCSEHCNPSCGCGKYVEIWNNVFMEYYKHEDGTYTKLKQKNVDTGLGLERINMLLQGKETPFDTEIFKPMMDKLQELAKVDNISSRRIIAEHLRSSMMIISDGGKPSNIDRGYILRRLIRRMIRHLNKLGISLENLENLINLDIEILGEMYPELVKNKENIVRTILDEKDKFMKTLENGEKELIKELNKQKEKGENKLSSEEVFRLYETYGFPQELTKEIAEENGFVLDLTEIDKLFKAHQEKSRLGSEQKFKGGLAEQNEQTIAYHTATHLLHKALQMVLGEHATQKGSNITTERLRFDFAHPQKVTREELDEVEVLVVVTSLSPYKKVLKGEFKLVRDKNGLASINKKYKSYLDYDELILSNSFNEEKCVSVKWDSSKIRFDYDKNLVMDFSKDSDGYINSIKVKLGKMDSVAYRFFRATTDDISEVDFSLQDDVC